MLGESHDLLHEFPDLTEKIDKLRTNNSTFSEFMTRYDTLDGRIRELEGLGQPVADETMEDLKKRRLALKDELYTLLKE